MDLRFEYPEDLKAKLALAEPLTDLSIRMYTKNARFWADQFETETYGMLEERFQILPDVTDQKLLETGYVMNEWVPKLAEGFPQDQTIAERTIAYNGRKPKGKVKDQLGLIIARIVPLFLLERHSKTQRDGIFGLKKINDEYVPHTMLEIPKDETYL